MFGKGAPFAVEDLPAGKLKEGLQGLTPQARGKAMKWLHSLQFEQADAATHLRVDKDGGVFITCPGNGKCGANCGHDHSGEEAPVEEAAEAEEGGEPQVAGASVPISDPPAYNSKPDAPYHIYMDFNGAYVTGKAWSSGDGSTTWDCHAWSSDGDRTTFSDSEHLYKLYELLWRPPCDYRQLCTQQCTYNNLLSS